MTASAPTLTVRRATPADLDIIDELESAGFPPAEAAPRPSLAARLALFSDRFWILFADGEPVSYVGGLTTDLPDLSDEMYADPTMHNPKGRFQMIFSVTTHPAHQRRGYAAYALRAAVKDCRAEGREALVLTCKQALIHFYASVGFADEGLSPSEHGGAVWHQMRLQLN